MMILMLDIHVFRDAPDRIRADLAKRKMDDSIVSDILRMDEDWRGIKFEVDQLRKKRNSSARMIAAAKKSERASKQADNKCTCRLSKAEMYVFRATHHQI